MIICQYNIIIIFYINIIIIYGIIITLINLIILLIMYNTYEIINKYIGVYIENLMAFDK